VAPNVEDSFRNVSAALEYFVKLQSFS